MALVQCRECGASVAKSAPTCPACGVRNPGRKGTPAWQWVVLVVGVIAVLNGVGSMATPTPAPSAADQAAARERQTEGEVQYACQQWVKQRLKAPATARFVRSSIQTGRRIGGDSTQWISRGQVDAQNSFGALLRNSYDCEVRVTASGITATSVTVE